jgi:phosphatidylglycerophosphatase A
LAWTWALLLPRHAGLYALGTAAGLAVSVWACGWGERLLGQKDPGSVVMDEIAAMPLCYAFWVGLWAIGPEGWPSWRGMRSAHMVGIWVSGFVLFRLFDILKPWPVRQSQRLAAGWGITLDDVLAAGYVDLVFAIAHFGL